MHHLKRRLAGIFPIDQNQENKHMKPHYTQSEEEVFAAANAMNHRPRKCLGYKTPWEVFTEYTQIEVFI